MNREEPPEMKKAALDQWVREQENCGELGQREIRQIQLQKLNALLKREKGRQGFYRNLPEHLASLEQLPELPVETQTPVQEEQPEEAVAQIEEKVLAAFGEQPAEEPAQTQEEPAPAEEDYPEGDPFATDEAEEEPTRRIDLRDLKFGRNYNRSGD